MNNDFELKQIQNAAIERDWEDAEANRIADGEFRRARRRAIARRLWRFLGGSRIGAPLEEAFDGGGIGIDRIAGLSPLPRSLARAWREAYRALDQGDGAGRPFALRRDGALLRLEGGTRELLRLELRRSRGESSIDARPLPDASAEVGLGRDQPNRDELGAAAP